LNYTKFKWILACQWKTEIELFKNSVKYSWFLSQHRILPYLFVNTLFNGHSIGSGFTKFGSENDKLFVYMLKNSVTICQIFERIFPVLNKQFTSLKYSVFCHFVSSRLTPNSLCLTEYRSYLLLINGQMVEWWRISCVEETLSRTNGIRRNDMNGTEKSEFEEKNLFFVVFSQIGFQAL